MDTDKHRSEGVAKKARVTQRAKDAFQRNLCSSVSICGFLLFYQMQLPGLGSISQPDSDAS
jgi:hypothetical protein